MRHLQIHLRIYMYKSVGSHERIYIYKRLPVNQYRSFDWLIIEIDIMLYMYSTSNWVRSGNLIIENENGPIRSLILIRLSYFLIILQR